MDPMNSEEMTQFNALIRLFITAQKLFPFNKNGKEEDFPMLPNQIKALVEKKIRGFSIPSQNLYTMNEKNEKEIKFLKKTKDFFENLVAKIGNSKSPF